MDVITPLGLPVEPHVQRVVKACGAGYLVEALLRYLMREQFVRRDYPAFKPQFPGGGDGVRVGDKYRRLQHGQYIPQPGFRL